MAVIPPLPSKATVSTWRLLPRIAFDALLDPMGVVILMTASALIAGVLEVAPRPFSKLTIGICFGIAILGLVTIVHHIRKLHRFDMAREWINRLLAEGHQLVIAVSASRKGKTIREFPSAIYIEDEQQYNLIVDWCNRTEKVLMSALTKKCRNMNSCRLDRQEGFKTEISIGGC